MSEAAIAVFDSGLGGLTCVKQLVSLVPHENIIYFGDTARVPYGNRSTKTISRYASQAIDFLTSKNVKLLINACGSMSSSLDFEYTKTLQLPYLDCINPAALAAVKATKNNNIGVIATAATIKSNAFIKAIHNIDSDINIISKACPLFVPLVECGYIERDNQICRLVVESYLKEIKESGVDTLVLGCTHYPIISDIISDFMGEAITLIDSGAEAAKQAAKILEVEAKTNGTGGSLEVYISDSPIGFLEVATTFLGFTPKDVTTVDIEAIEESRDQT